MMALQGELGEVWADGMVEWFGYRVFIILLSRFAIYDNLG